MRLRIRQATVLDAPTAAEVSDVAPEELERLLGREGAYVFLVVDDEAADRVEGVARAGVAPAGSPTLLELATFALTDAAWGTEVAPTLLQYTVGDADCTARTADERVRQLLLDAGFSADGDLLIRRAA